MKRVDYEIWAEQDATHSRLMIRVGNDPAVEWMKWNREYVLSLATRSVGETPVA